MILTETYVTQRPVTARLMFTEGMTLGRSYVAPVSEGKPVFSGFSAEEMEKIKIVSRGDFDLEDGKYYTFRLIKIELGFCRKLIKIKFRVLEEIDFASLK